MQLACLIPRPSPLLGFDCLQNAKTEEGRHGISYGNILVCLLLLHLLPFCLFQFRLLQFRPLLFRLLQFRLLQFHLLLFRLLLFRLLQFHLVLFRLLLFRLLQFHLVLFHLLLFRLLQFHLVLFRLLNVFTSVCFCFQRCYDSPRFCMSLLKFWVYSFKEHPLKSYDVQIPKSKILLSLEAYLYGTWSFGGIPSKNIHALMPYDVQRPKSKVFAFLGSISLCDMKLRRQVFRQKEVICSTGITCHIVYA